MTLRAFVALMGGWRATAFAAALLAALAFGGIQSVRLAHANTKAAEAASAADRAAAASAVAQVSAVEAMRQEEHARAGAVNAADVAYQRGLQDGKAAADNVLAGVADGTYVLRDKFRCPARAAEASAGPGVGDGRAPAVLSDADVQFLVRIASEADDTVRQLAACQAVVEADRQ